MTFANSTLYTDRNVKIYFRLVRHMPNSQSNNFLSSIYSHNKRREKSMDTIMYIKNTLVGSFDQYKKNIWLHSSQMELFSNSKNMKHAHCTVYPTTTQNRCGPWKDDKLSKLCYRSFLIVISEKIIWHITERMQTIVSASSNLIFGNES